MNVDTIINIIISLIIGTLFLILSIYLTPKKTLSVIIRTKEKNIFSKLGCTLSSKGVQSYRVLIKNTGKKGIKEVDIPKGLNVALSGNFEILNTKIIDNTPHVCARITSFNQYVVVTFNYLNPNDYLLIEYTVEGETSAMLYSSPLIDGKVFMYAYNDPQHNFFGKVFSFFLSLFLPLLSLMIGVLSTVYFMVDAFVSDAEAVKQFINWPNIYDSELINWFLLFSITIFPILIGLILRSLWYGYIQKVLVMRSLPDKVKEEF